MLIVSHIDDDHINGVVALTDELAEYRTAREALRRSLWSKKPGKRLGCLN